MLIPDCSRTNTALTLGVCGRRLARHEPSASVLREEPVIYAPRLLPSAAEPRISAAPGGRLGLPEDFRPNAFILEIQCRRSLTTHYSFSDVHHGAKSLSCHNFSRARQPTPPARPYPLPVSFSILNDERTTANTRAYGRHLPYPSSKG